MFEGYKPQDTCLLTFHMPYLPQYQYSLCSMHRHTQLYSQHLNVCDIKKRKCQILSYSPDTGCCNTGEVGKSCLELKLSAIVEGQQVVTDLCFTLLLITSLCLKFQ